MSGSPPGPRATTKDTANKQTASEKSPKRAPAKKAVVEPAAKPAEPTLADVVAGYLEHLEQRGSSESTISGYRAELKAAARTLGEDTLISSITVEHVERYFESDAVTKTRAGRPRSTRTIDRSRRVLRLALWWAEETKLISKAPIREDEPAPAAKATA